MKLNSLLIQDYYVNESSVINEKTIWFLTLLFFALSLIGILNHELWLDESHHWLLGRDSVSLIDLINNTRYEGHPILWNLIIYSISRFTLNPIWMQFIHIAISSTVVFIFLKKSPFNWTFKILFIFGYFMFFEYNIISRNYSLGLLFLLLACSIYNKRDDKFILLCIYLSLAINTHLIFSVVSFALFLTLLFESHLKKNLYKKLFSVGSLIILISIVISVIQIIPPSDTSFFETFRQKSLLQKLMPGFTSFFKGILPIPDFRTIHFWNSNIFVNLSLTVSAILSIMVYAIPLLLFKRRKNTLFFVYIALIGIQIFFFATQRSAARFFGMTFIVLIMGLWLDYYNRERSKNQLKSSRVTLFIYSILFIHFCSGIYACTMDLIYPFSVSKKVKSVLKDNNLLHEKVVTPFCEGTIFAPYLKNKIYFLCSNDYDSFCKWNKHTVCDFSNEGILNQISNLKIAQSVIFVSDKNVFGELSYGNWYDIDENFSVKPIVNLGESITRKMANYNLYEIRYNQFYNR